MPEDIFLKLVSVFRFFPCMIPGSLTVTSYYSSPDLIEHNASSNGETEEVRRRVNS